LPTTCWAARGALSAGESRQGGRLQAVRRAEARLPLFACFVERRLQLRDRRALLPRVNASQAARGELRARLDLQPAGNECAA